MQFTGCVQFLSSKAFHGYLRRIVKQVVKLTNANMGLKLRVLQFTNQLAHTTAFKHPTLRQVTQSQFLVPLFASKSVSFGILSGKPN